VSRELHKIYPDTKRLPALMRGRRFLEELISLGFNGEIVSPRGIMGGDLLASIGYNRVSIVSLRTPYIDGLSSREHTVEFISRSSELGCSLIAFVGGDGTARDVYEAMGGMGAIPVLGIPAGVKVYSGVFAISPEAAAYIAILFFKGSAYIEARPIIDADEEALRKGVLSLRRYGSLLTIAVGGLLQASKETGSVYDVEGIARYIGELMERGRLYILGPGRTIYEVAKALGIEKTPFGVDAIYNMEVVGRDLDAVGIERLVSKYGKPYILLTPIGGTGFLLGRGNQQITPAIVRAAGKEGILIVMTPEKASRLAILMVDTGDMELDMELEGYYRAVIGYREEKVVAVRASWRLSKALR